MNFKEMARMEDEKKIAPIKSLPDIAEFFKSETLEELQKASCIFLSHVILLIYCNKI